MNLNGLADTPAALTARVKERALALGFARVGVARAEPLDVEGERLRAWVAAGRHATMTWMATTADARCDPSAVLAGARSVVVVAMPYARAGEPPELGRIARYARGRDYHNVLGKRVRKLASMLRAEGHAARGTVDAQPVYERAWAERAGLGFVGKSCMLIVPGLGSYVMLATVMTTAELVPDARMPERCGECRACLDACPTKAFVAERQLDARRCISYLTIEHRGPIAEELREGLGDRLFGCDACQEVCPFDKTAPPPEDTTRPFATDVRRRGFGAAEMLGLSDAALDALASGTPLARAGAPGLRRNAALVVGNRGERRHLPVLRAVAESAAETEPVRDAARWAAARLGRGPP